MVNRYNISVVFLNTHSIIQYVGKCHSALNRLLMAAKLDAEEISARGCATELPLSS